MSGFVERVIEDWLIKADERTYQLPFAAYLGRRGHRLKYISKHTSLELGKDLITVDPNGKVHAYQLKAGSINLAEWREIVGEVRQCADTPINVPGMPQAVPNFAYLVLTGQVADPVRAAIALINADNRSHGWPEIEIIELPELVANLSAEFEAFFPSSITSLTDLMRIYLSDGRGPLDKTRLAETMEDACKGATSNTKAARVASNLVLMAEFASSPFRHHDNHISVLDSWVMAAINVIRIAKVRKLRANFWMDSFMLCKEAIERAERALLKEAKARKTIHEGNVVIDSNFINFRKLIVLGYLAAGLNRRTIDGESVDADSRWLVDVLRREVPFAVWGEGAWTLQLNIGLALRHSPEGGNLSEEMITEWLHHVCPRRPPWPKEPYWSVEDELNDVLGRAPKEPEYERARVSFTVESACGFLVRRFNRGAIRTSWPQMSRFGWATFEPMEHLDELRWQVEKGATKITEQALQGSWRILLVKAFRQRSDLFTDSEKWLLPYFLNTFPHRTSPFLAGEIEFATSPTGFREEWDARRDAEKSVTWDAKRLE